MSVYGRTEYTFYRLPYNAEAKIQPLFKDNERREAFFEDKQIERIEILSTSTSTATFSPKQTSFKLVTGVGDEYIKIPVASRVAWALREYKRINYMRVRRFFAPTTGIPATSSSFDDICFWVTGVDVMPVVQKRPEGVTQNAELAFMLSIALDAWGTYIHPYNGTTTGAYGLRQTTYIEQSTPSQKINGGASPLFGEYPLALDKNSLSTRAYSLKTGGGSLALDFGEPWFVGVFTTSKSDWSQIVCARPLRYRDSEAGDIDEDDFRKLLTIQTLVRWPIRGNDFLSYTAKQIKNDTNESVLEANDATPEVLGNVQLIRAFIVPHKLLQAYESTFALKDQENPDGGEGAQAWSTAHAGVVQFDNIADVIDHSRGLILLATDKCKDESIEIPFTANEYDNIVESDFETFPPVFMDFGTATKRIELPQPRDGESGASNVVRITSGVYKTGANVLIECGAQTIDVGGDFEIAIPYNQGQAEAQRNKWSYALQGVASIGGSVAAIATGNPIASVMAITNTAQLFARQSEQKNNPSTIQGQGNGEFLFARSPMLYVRYFPPTSDEEAVAERWGFRWLRARTDDVSNDGDELLLYPDMTQTQTRLYIKTAGASLYPSQYFETPSPQIPADARMAIEEDLDAGVTLIINPPTTDEEIFYI